MTREEAIERLNKIWIRDALQEDYDALHMAIMALEHPERNVVAVVPCEDCVSREAVLNGLASIAKAKAKSDAQKALMGRVMFFTEQLPPVTPKQKLCKDCKFFEYDHMENVDGIPLIVAHEICNKWGDGCRTSEDGYCFLFKPKEGESE